MHNSQKALLTMQERADRQQDCVKKIQEYITYLKTLSQVTDWDLSLGVGDLFSLEVRDQAIEEIEQSESCHLSVRIFVDHCSGSATCLGAQIEDWKEAAQKALSLANLAQPDEFSRLPDAKYFQKDKRNIALESQEALTQEELFQHALHIEQLSLEGVETGVLQSNGSSVSAQYSLTIRANSRGLWTVIPSTIYGHGISLVVHGEDGSDSEWAGQQRRQWAPMDTAQKVASLVQQRALAQRERKSIPTGDYPVIFSHRCSYTLIKHMLAAVSGRAQYLKSTFLLNSVGTPVLPEWVTLEDEPHLDYGLGSYPIDSDGLPTSPQVLIKDGVLQQYILSHYSALRLGLEPNGLASGVMNPKMTTNVKSFDELLALYPKCIVIDSVTGPGVSISQGTYSRGAEGFYYENGKRLFALREVTVATSLLPFYLSLQAHAPDYEPGSAWRIGSLAFPSIRVSGEISESE